MTTTVFFHDDYVPTRVERALDWLQRVIAPLRLFKRIADLEESLACNEAVLNAVFGTTGRHAVRIELLELAAEGRALREQAAAAALARHDAASRKALSLDKPKKKAVKRK